MRRRPVVQAERDARVLRMEQRSLALDEQQLAPRACPSTTSRSAAPAMKSATTASTEIPQPAIAIPVWPVGTNSDASPRRRASRSSSSATVIFPIAQSEPTVRTIVAGTSRFSPVGTFRSGGGFRRSRSSTSCSRASSTSSASSVEELVQAVLDVEPVRDAVRICSRNAGGKRPPAVATPTSAVFGSKQSASSTVPTIGKPCSRLARALGVEQRDDLLRRVAHDAARGLAEMRVAGFALSENQVPRALTPSPGALDGS